eukprot:TRINITY_DN769_c0_g1_i3.p1 TRINITY_DN769_c0_g1~~TRINITY_DN769_c0_g1_i3.p1  ORF type:complete len:185 (-),score=27.43 TRINITY_DN769_c0_g1_i3:61-615(-)
MKLTTCFLILIYGIVWVQAKLCGVTLESPSHTFDFSAFAGKIYLVEGYNLNNTLDYAFELTLCENIKSPYPGCKVPSPVNRILQWGSNCTHVGDLKTESWDFDPDGNGVYLTYYHGQLWENSTVIHMSARIYFECSEHEIGYPRFEHITDCGQHHFSWATKYACWGSTTSSGTSSMFSTQQIAN